ncbi:MAG TPA: hypothetical protein PLD62_00240 [Candidatus Cloacimonadota bacterium]|nr:hypothetical protein [Candidatus Cloacimonadota bacterium]
MRVFFIAILTLFVFTLSAEIILNHDPILSVPQGDEIGIDLEVREGVEAIRKITLFYREQGDLAYKEIELDPGSVSETVFTFSIPDADSYQAGIEYFFQVETNSSEMVTLPAFNPQTTPFLLNIVKPEQPLTTAFILLSPDQEYTDFSRDFVIAVSYFALQKSIDPASIKFLLDGKDASDKAEIYSNMLIYKVGKLAGGKHDFQIVALLQDGSEVKSEKWQMKIVRKNWRSGLNLTGKAVLNTFTAFDVSDQISNENRANLLLTMSGKQKWLGFNGRIYLSSLETENAQPVNRYSLSFLTKVLNVTAGDQSPDYSTFLLSGTNVRGFHSNLHFTNFRLKASYGKSNRAVDGRESFDAGTFATNTLGMRAEFGKTDGFTWGIGLTKNKDEVSSLAQKYIFADSSFTTFAVQPQDNVILGTDFSWALFRSRLLLGGEVAISFLNRNIYDGAMSIEEIEDSLDIHLDLPFDPVDLEDFLVINQYLEPFTPGLKNIAYKTWLRTYFWRNFLNVNYSAVGSSFNSLSSNYLQSDTAVLGINDNINVIKNKLNLNLSLNFISDNLNDEKDVTTKTASYNTQVTYRFNPEVDFRVAFSQNTTDNSGDDDLESSIISVGTGYDWKEWKTAETRFSFNFMNYNNNFDLTDSTDYDYTKNNFVFSARSNFSELPLETMLSYTFSQEDKNDISQNYNSLYLKGILSLLEDNLKPYCDLQLMKFGGDSETQSMLFNLGTGYQLFKQTLLSTNLGGKIFKDNDDKDKDYNNLTWRFKIVQHF